VGGAVSAGRRACGAWLPKRWSIVLDGAVG
jgi:hypothetical protein